MLRRGNRKKSKSRYVDRYFPACHLSAEQTYTLQTNAVLLILSKLELGVT